MKLSKFLKSSLIISGSLLLILSLYLNAPQAQAQEINSLNFTPQVPIGKTIFSGGQLKVGTYDESKGKMSSELLSKYIQALYNYGLGIAGILAAIVLMGGGLIWLTSGGESGRIAQAKNLIVGSVTGLIILFCSWIILNTINPDLLKLRSIETTVIKKMNYCCDVKKGHTLSDRDGKCLSGTVCQGAQECMNNGNNAFACIDKNKFFCCEYKPKAGTNFVKCLSVTTGCPAGGQDWNWSKRYDRQYCGDKTVLANSCLAGDCTGKDNGEYCEGLSSGAFGAYCYNEMCWTGAGKEGEPCGNEKGSSCLKDGSRCDNHDYSGGRDCGEDLFCCQKIKE